MCRVLLLIDIASGIIGLLSGTLAMGLRKGSLRHRTVDHLFCAQFLTKPKLEDLSALLDLRKAGKITPVVDNCYNLNQVPRQLGISSRNMLAEKL